MAGIGFELRKQRRRMFWEGRAQCLLGLYQGSVSVVRTCLRREIGLPVAETRDKCLASNMDGLLAEGSVCLEGSSDFALSVVGFWAVPPLVLEALFCSGGGLQ